MNKQLRELADIHYGKGPSEVLSEDGPFPVVGTGGIYGRANSALFSGPAVVVARKGSLGNPQFMNAPFWPVDTTYAVIPKDGIDAKWLYYNLDKYDLTKLNEATGVPSISRDWLCRISFDDPGCDQQQKIAEILSTLDEAIEQTEVLIAKMQQVKAGLMHDLFTRGVTPEGRLRPTREQAPELYKESPLGWIPKEWEVVPLTAFAAPGSTGFVNGPFGSDLLTSELQESGVPVIYVKDIKENEYRRVSEAHVTEEKANSLNFCNARFGDVLIAKVGDPPCIAAPYMIKERAVVTQDVIRIRPADDVNTEFLVGLINSSVGTGAIKRIVIEGTRARVSLTELKRIEIPKPQHEEQRLIADRLSAVQNILTSLEADVAKIEDRKNGLMQDLLTGLVRVQQGGEQ